MTTHRFLASSERQGLSLCGRVLLANVGNGRATDKRKDIDLACGHDWRHCGAPGADD